MSEASSSRRRSWRRLTAPSLGLTALRERLVGRSLLAKSLVAVLTPLVIVLLVVGIGGFFAATRIAEQVVQQRDAELARVSADRLSERLDELFGPLERSATTLSSPSATPEELETLVAEIRASAEVPFDVGLLFYDRQGTVVASDPPWLVRLPQWLEYLDRSQLRQVRDERQSSFSSVFSDPVTGVDFILASVPVEDVTDEVSGILAAAISLQSDFLEAIADVRVGDEGIAYLVDERGSVIYHPDLDLVGDNVTDLEAVDLALGGRSGAVIADGSDGERSISGYAPVGSTGWGVVTEQRWDSVIGPIRQAAQVALLVIIAGGIVAAGSLAYVIRRLFSPISRLTEGAEQIAAGDFSQRVDTDIDEELRGLAERFNSMAGALEESYANLEDRVRQRTAENQRLYEEAAERAQELAELNRRAVAVAGVAQEVGTLTRLDALLPAVSQRLLDTFGYSSVIVFLLDEATDELVPQGEAAEHTPRRLLDDGAVGRAAASGDSLVVHDLTIEDGEDGVTGSEIAAPIHVGDLVVGVLDVRSPEPNVFDEADRFTVETFADQLAVAIENARLFEQTSDLAVLEERNRFAREIHDTIAQGLTGIVLQLEAMEQSLDGDPAESLDHLERARSLARECLQDARRSVWNLLPDRLVENSLDEALDQEITRFAGDGSEDGKLVVVGRPRALRRDVQSAMLRIAQEAMTNVRKHAEAEAVEVEVAYLPGFVRLRITDDGRGIEGQPTRHSNDGGGFGLGGMEQRVQQLFGTLDIRNVDAGSGTVVEATIPAD